MEEYCRQMVFLLMNDFILKVEHQRLGELSAGLLLLNTSTHAKPFDPFDNGINYLVIGHFILGK